MCHKTEAQKDHAIHQISKTCESQKATISYSKQINWKLQHVPVQHLERFYPQSNQDQLVVTLEEEIEAQLILMAKSHRRK